MRFSSVLSTSTAFSAAGVVIATGGDAPNVIRMFIAYWITMIAASLFIACLVIGLQGLAATLLPRPAFLRASSYLQLGTFVVVINAYLMLPAAVTPASVVAAQQANPLALPPWYWFLALFQQLSGMPQIGPVARYAWWSLGVTLGWTMVAYTLSYFRTLRKIAEESDIAKRSRRAGWWPRAGSARQTAIVHFSVRTLLRSMQHRILLAFYWGIGFAIMTLFLSLPPHRGVRVSPPLSWESLWHERSVPLIVSSVVMLMTAVLGARVVFALPRDLRANWIFRIAPLRGGSEYLGARRRALFVASVLPVWLLSAAVFLVAWPPLAAAGHLLVLWLLGATLVEVYLYGTRKIPFTCSYLPGKSTFQAIFWVSILLLVALIAALGAVERRALEIPPLYAQLAGTLGVVWLITRTITTMRNRGAEAQPQFEEEPGDRMVSLGVWDVGAAREERRLSLR